MGKTFQQGKNELGGIKERGLAMCDLAETALADDVLSYKEGFYRKIAHEPVGRFYLKPR